MIIRIATPSDLAAIVACAELAFLAKNAPDTHGSAENDDELADQIRHQNLHVITEGTDPTVVGYISLVPIADHLFVDSIAVLPEKHDRGFGTRLLRFAELEAARLGLDSVRLYTQQTSPDAFAFYQYRGYTETDRCNDDGFPRVFYCKDVSSNQAAASASRAS
jgi:ribosomal protein S18 acetylase RimI-like enzyme